MAKCEDCLHYVVCEALENGNGIKKVCPAQCGCFEDKNIIKANAIKEFAERLKEDISNHRTEMYMNGLKGTPRTKEITYECVEEYIDNLLKELVGEDNA